MTPSIAVPMPAGAVRPATPAAARRHRILSLCIAAALAPATAFAGPDAGGGAVQATDLDAVRVTGQRPDRYGTRQTSTATRLELSPRETPQSVSAISREQMDDFGLDSVNDVLDATTGVTVEAVETSRTYYTARGFDITNFQRDGLGLPLPYGIQDGDLDTALYERIEVLRGANGLMSSTGNPSATVNFVRKRPTADLRGQAQLTLGSWNRRRIDIDVSGPLAGEGGVRGRAVAAWEKGDSHLDRYSLEKQVYYGVVEADLGAATTLAAGASYQRNNPNSPLWGALPLYYSDGSPTDFDVSTSTASDWSFWDQEDTRAFVELDHAVGDWNLRASLNHEKMESDTALFYVFGTPDREAGSGLFAYPSDYDGAFSARYADVYATGPITFGGREHDAVIGGNWADGENSERSLFAAYPAGYDADGDGDIDEQDTVRFTALPSTGLDNWNGRFPKPAWEQGDAYSDGSKYDYRRQSLYATVRWNLSDTFKLITGASRSRARVRGHSYGEANTVDETRTTPFAGVVWDLGEHYSAYASHGEIFNQQSEVDEDNRLLGALTGSNSELGLKGEWFDGGLNASLAVFRTRQDNLAESAGFNTDTGQTYYRGVDAESQGFEIDVAGRIGEHWQVAGGFTRLQVDDAEGRAARPYVPRELFRVSTTWQVPGVEALRLGARLNWQGDIHRDTAIVDADGRPARIRQDAYALLGMMARYDFAPGWSATLNLDNVTDEKYIPSLYWEQGYYGAPRHASLTFGYRF